MNGPYRRADRVDWVVVGGEAVLFDSVTGQLFELDHWAVSIWTALDGVETIDAIVEMIASSVDAPRESVGRDVRQFCAGLAERQLIETANGGAVADGAHHLDRAGEDHCA